MLDGLASLSPLAGGHSGRTFVGEAGGERVVVRIYEPDDPAPEKDAAVLALVRGLVPVADVLEVRRGDADHGQPGVLVTSWLTGERGDLALDRLDAEARERMGRSMGSVAGTLAGMPCLRPGPFLDADLSLGRFPDGGLVEWTQARLGGAPAGDSPAWPEAELARLVEVCRPAEDLLDTVGRACVVHSDLNPKNVLVDPATGEVIGVVDWELAHAGHPWTDLGNLLRFERDADHVGAVLTGWSEQRGGHPVKDAVELLDGARAADLWALVDLAAREGENPVADRAANLLRAIAGTGDLHAWPEA